MSEHDDTWNLTGVWQGSYTYPGGRGPVSFVATLIESGGSFSGSTHEPHEFRSATLFATVAGRRDGRSVTFTKTCIDGGVEYGSPIEYEGTLSADGTELEGTWTIAANWSGRFLMIRSGRKAATASTKKFETA